MGLSIFPALALLAFLAGLWGCQDQGTTKPPEGRITKSTRVPRSPAAMRTSPRGTGPVREDLYPPDEVPLWKKTPEELKAQIRKDFQDSGIPQEFVEAEIDALANQVSPSPQSPKGREFRPDASPRMLLPDPAKLREELREGLEQAGVPQRFIDAELQAMVGGGASPPSQPSPGRPLGASEAPAGRPLPDPATLRQELTEGLKQAGVPQKFIDAELEAMVGGASPPSQPSPGRPPGASQAPLNLPLPDPATLSQELIEGMKQAGVPQRFIDAELEGMVPGSSQPPQDSPETPSGFPESFP
jgi:hypothetical protein